MPKELSVNPVYVLAAALSIVSITPADALPDPRALQVLPPAESVPAASDSTARTGRAVIAAGPIAAATPEFDRHLARIAALLDCLSGPHKTRSC